jgi:nucleotide-binding universal stress UspA family protein
MRGRPCIDGNADLAWEVNMAGMILAVFDGRPCQARALAWVARLAKGLDARLRLVALEVKADYGADMAEIQGAVPPEAAGDLANMVSSLAQRGVAVQTHRLPAAFDRELVDEISASGVELVVLCTGERPALGHWPHRTVSGTVLAHSPVPVMVVEAGIVPSTLGERQDVCLVPLDGSGFAESALPSAAALARALDASMVLLRVVPPLPLYPDSVLPDPAVERKYVEREMATAEEYLAEMAARLTADGLRVTTRAEYDLPAQTILAQEETTHAELVVMATHGCTGWRKLLLGSVALEVLQRGVVPLLLVRPAALRGRLPASAEPSN